MKIKVFKFIKVFFSTLYHYCNQFIWVLGMFLCVLIGIASYAQSPFGFQTSTQYTSLMYSQNTGLVLIIIFYISVIGQVIVLISKAVKFIKSKRHKDKSLQERIREVEK